MFKIFNRLGIVGKASILLAVFQLLSRLVGLLRDRVLASHFGASNILDVYYVSFNIPDFVFNLLVAGAVSAAFIPVFIEVEHSVAETEQALGKQGQVPKGTALLAKSQRMSNIGIGTASNFLNFLLLTVIAVSAILYFLVPLTISVAAPGFTPEKKDLAILFTRVMLLSPVIFSVSVVIGSLLQVFHKFFAFALAPIMYNLGIIFGALVLEPRFGPLGLAEGVVLGALLHLVIQLPSVWRIGFRWQNIWNWGDGGMRKIFTLTIPRAIGLAGAQIYAIIEDALATTVGVGTVAVFNLASNLQYLPIALTGISVAVASFPTLSREALQEEKKEFISHVGRRLRQVLFLVIPFSFLFFFLRQEVVRIILQSGYFSSGDTSLAARVLAFFLLGVAAQSVIPILSRSFYAMQNTKTPLLISLVSILLNLSSALYFVKIVYLGGSGLALAFSLAGILNALLLLVFLKKTIASFDLAGLIFYLVKLLFVSFIMFLLLSLVSSFGFLATAGLGGEVLRVIFYGLLALLTFLLFSRILKISFSGKDL